MKKKRKPHNISVVPKKTIVNFGGNRLKDRLHLRIAPICKKESLKFVGKAKKHQKGGNWWWRG